MRAGEGRGCPTQGQGRAAELRWPLALGLQGHQQRRDLQFAQLASHQPFEYGRGFLLAEVFAAIELLQQVLQVYGAALRLQRNVHAAITCADEATVAQWMTLSMIRPPSGVRMDSG